MESLVAAYVLVWLAVVLFVARLAQRQRKLQQRYESLRAQVQAAASDHESRSQAA